MASLRDDLSSRLAGTRSYSFAGRSVVELLGVPVTTKITMDYRRDGAMRIHFPSPLLSIEYRSDGERTMIAVPTRGVYTVTESLADTVGFSGDLLHDIPAYTGLVDLLLPPLARGRFREDGRDTIQAGGERRACTVLRLEPGTGVFSRGDTTRVDEARIWLDAGGIPWRWQAAAILHDDRFTGGSLATTATSYVEKLVFDPELPDSLFRLEPPEGLREVTGTAGLLAVKDGVGRDVSDLTGTTLDGDTIPLVPTNGRVTLVEFWATWCHPCRRSLAEMAEHADTLSAVANVVLVATEEEETVRRFLELRSLPFQVVLDPQHTLQKALAVRQLPTLMIVDGDGRVSATFIGSQSMPDLLAAIERIGNDGKGP